jgi:hypothetical protein
MNNKTTVAVHFSQHEVALVDAWRQNVKARTGKMPMRSVAIAQMISVAGKGIEPYSLRSYAELQATVEHNRVRICRLEQSARAAKGGE